MTTRKEQRDIDRKNVYHGKRINDRIANFREMMLSDSINPSVFCNILRNGHRYADLENDEYNKVIDNLNAPINAMEIFAEDPEFDDDFYDYDDEDDIDEYFSEEEYDEMPEYMMLDEPTNQVVFLLDDTSENESFEKPKLKEDIKLVDTLTNVEKLPPLVQEKIISELSCKEKLKVKLYATEQKIKLQFPTCKTTTSYKIYNNEDPGDSALNNIKQGLWLRNHLSYHKFKKIKGTSDEENLTSYRRCGICKQSCDGAFHLCDECVNSTPVKSQCWCDSKIFEKGFFSRKELRLLKRCRIIENYSKIPPMFILRKRRMKGKAVRPEDRESYMDNK